LEKEKEKKRTIQVGKKPPFKTYERKERQSSRLIKGKGGAEGAAAQLAEKKEKKRHKRSIVKDNKNQWIL